MPARSASTDTSVHAVDSITTEKRLADIADSLLRSGRVVPGLTIEPDGRARSWWWPLPTAAHRPLLGSLAADASQDAQRDIASRLAGLVDAAVRSRLTAEKISLVPHRRGRTTVQEAWLRSLTSLDPFLPSSLNAERVHELSAKVSAWVRSGAVVTGRARLCLRVHEPSGRRGSWEIELLAQDQDEPSLVVPLASLWDGSSPLPPSTREGVLAALSRMARLAPETAPALDQPAPSRFQLDDEALAKLLRERVGALDDAGVGVLLPEWWKLRPRLGLRARTRKSGSSPSGATAGLGLDTIVSFQWEAALGDERLTQRDLADLSRAVEAKQSLVRLRGQWVEIDPFTVRDLLDAIGTRGAASLSEFLRAALGMEKLGVPSSLDVLGVEVTRLGWLKDLLEGALHARVEARPTPAGFEGQLRPYQERGVGWLVFLGALGLGACLADDMGLGKTAQLIASVLADPAPGPTLVVCPVSVLGNWERELARFSPSLRVLVHHGPERHRRSKQRFPTRAKRHDVVLTTYSLLARDMEDLSAVRWGRLVLDEAQQIKNPSALQARAVRQLRADRRVALTGTPVENRLSELWSIMQVLNPGFLGSAREFRERFALPVERDGDPDAADRLRRAVGPFILRRLKTDRSIVPDLPEKIETVDQCPLTREQATLYQAVVNDLLDETDEAEGMTRRGLVLAGLLRLKQVCNHPAHFLADGSALRGRSGKLTRTEELLEEIVSEGDKVLCFTQFTAWGGLLRPYLEYRFATDVLWLHGGMRRAARDEMIESFSDPAGPSIFLLSLKAGGTGLNLTTANHVIHLDRWWNPAVEDQATDRAYRIGQRHTVQVHKLVSAGTVEERIDSMISAKRELAERVVGTGEEWLTELSTDELRDLVTLREGAVE